MRRALPVLLLAAGLAGCGGGEDAPASPADVIRSWADALRSGDVEAASDAFALPAVVANGTPPVRLRRRGQVRAFNVALPCGAILLRTRRRGPYVVAVFRLTDRRGPGAVRPCGGDGAEAATAFRIRAGRIREWRRVPVPGGAPGNSMESET